MAGVKESTEIDVQALWGKYEDITMHFNDLLMRLRTSSLAAIPALSTVVGIFADSPTEAVSLDWAVAAGLFSAMSFVWLAIFCLDFYYYNKLLSGAVAAVVQLETNVCSGEKVPGINLSTLIEQEFSLKKPATASNGVFAFYGIVLALLVAGALFSLRMFGLEGAPAAITAEASPLPSPSVSPQPPAN
jgi:hypothetical protein